MSTQIVSARSQPPRLMDQLRDLAHRHFGRPEPGQRLDGLSADEVLEAVAATRRLG